MSEDMSLHTRTCEQVAAYVQQFRLRDVRSLFQIMRTVPTCSPDTLVPSLGITVGEFVTYYTIHAKRRR